MPERPEKLVADLERTAVLKVEDGNHGEYRPRPDEFAADGVPYIRAADLDDGRIRFDLVSRINETALARLRKGIGRPGDVILSHKGTVGKVALAPLGCEPFVCSPQTTFWRVLDESAIDRRFLFYYLRSSAFRAKLLARENESDMAGYVSLTQQRQLRIVVPRMRHQRGIASLLGALDDKIELNRRIAATAHELGHAIFRSRYRSDDPELPYAPLGDHLEIARGLSYTGAGLADEGMPLHNLDSVVAEGGYNRAGIKRYTGDYRERHVVQAGEVVLANTDLTWNYRVIASPARIPRCFGETGLFSHHLYRVRRKPSSPLSSTFLYLLLLSGRLRTEIVGYANGTTVNMLPVDALQKPRFAVPPRELVEEIDALVRPLFDRGEAAENESETLAQLRDTLLPKLISGELRLRDGETSGPPADRTSTNASLT